MRDQALEAKVIDGRLVISVGVDALKSLVETGEGWAQLDARITDADAFANAIGTALVEPVDDGDSELRFAIERAADWVVDEGGGGVEEA